MWRLDPEWVGVFHVGRYRVLLSFLYIRRLGLRRVFSYGYQCSRMWRSDLEHDLNEVWTYPGIEISASQKLKTASANRN